MPVVAEDVDDGAAEELLPDPEPEPEPELPP